MLELLQRLRRPLSCALLLSAAVAATPAAASGWTLDAAAWASPRSGRAVLSMPPLPQVVRAWSEQPDAAIVIRHPGGERGVIWAAELRDWLVALGVPGRDVETVGGGEPEQLTIVVR